MTSAPPAPSRSPRVAGIVVSILLALLALGSAGYFVLTAIIGNGYLT
jgi:hypothetical protein